MTSRPKRYCLTRVTDDTFRRAVAALHETMCPCGWGAQICRRHDPDDLQQWTAVVLRAAGLHTPAGQP